MKDLDSLSYFLSFEIFYFSDGYYLTQAKYISNMLSWANLTDNKVANTPIELKTSLWSFFVLVFGW